MYKTYAPIKQTSHTMALAICEVTALLTDTFTDKFCGLDAAAYHTERACVTETILDILDLYEKHRGFSELARQFPADTFIELKIVINRELEEKGLPRYKFQCAACEKDPDPASDSEDPDFLRAAAAARPGDVPTRYVFDTEAAVAELGAVRGYFVDDFEVVEVEEEEEVRDSPPPPAAREHQPRGPRGPRGGGGGRGRRGGGAGGPPRGPGGGPPRGPNGPPRDGGGRDHGGAGGRGGHGGNWRSRNRHGNRRRRD